jgi:hypothetical protein
MVVAGTYLVLAFVPFWPAWSNDPSRWLQAAGTADVGQSAFFVAQLPAALVHGIDPLANTWTNWPYGANYMDNTAVPLLALLMAPVTLIGNAILSLNLLYVLTVWANCLAAYLVVAHLVGRRAPAFVAGLLYGFSPIAVAGGYGHEQVLFDLLPPVAFLLLWRLCTGAGRPGRTGAALGVCAAAQLYIFAEPLAECAVVAAVGLVVAAFTRRHTLRSVVAPVVRGLAVAAGCFAVLGAYGVYVLEDGPAHIRGAAHPGGFPTLSADLFGFVAPTGNQRLTLGLGDVGTRLTSLTAGGHVLPDLADNGAYLGVPLLVVCIVGALWLRKAPLARWSAGLGAVALVLSMGPRLRVDGPVTPIRLPFEVVDHLPLLRGAIAARFASIEWWFVALLLAIVLTEVAAAVAGRARGAGRARWADTVVAGVLAVVALVPVIPAWPYGEARVEMPSLAVGRAIRDLPTGRVLLGYPFPTMNTYLMVFDAVDRMRFRLVGGSLIQPAANGENLYSAAPPSTCQTVLDADYEDAAADPVGPSTRTVCAREMLGWGVGTVLWTDIGAHPLAALAFLTEVLGPPSRSAGDSALWLHPRPALRAVAAGSRIGAAGSRTGAAAAPVTRT